MKAVKWPVWVKTSAWLKCCSWTQQELKPKQSESDSPDNNMRRTSSLRSLSLYVISVVFSKLLNQKLQVLTASASLFSVSQIHFIVNLRHKTNNKKRQFYNCDTEIKTIYRYLLLHFTRTVSLEKHDFKMLPLYKTALFTQLKNYRSKQRGGLLRNIVIFPRRRLKVTFKMKISRIGLYCRHVSQNHYYPCSSSCSPLIRQLVLHCPILSQSRRACCKRCADSGPLHG